MKTKLDSNGLTVYTVPTKKDCIESLQNLIVETSKNQYSLNHIPEIENAIKVVESENYDEVVKIKNTTNFKPLYRIFYIFEKEYLHELWLN